jgi:hypothetical protein
MKEASTDSSRGYTLAEALVPLDTVIGLPIDYKRI